MWVEERNGKYKFTERYEDYLTGKIKKVSITLDKNTVQSRKTAQRLLSERIAALQGDVPSKELTFEKLVDEYRKNQERSVKKSTYERNFHTCNTLITLLGKDTLVDRLNVNYINRKLLESRKDPGTLNEYLTRFRALIRWGYRNDLIEDIRYLDKLENFKDRPHKEKIQDKYLEEFEVKRLLSGMTHPVWKLFAEFMILSGLRFGEAAALQKEDVDFDACCIHVTKTFDSLHKVVTTPKSLCSIRDVYMQPELFALCKQINLYMLKLKFMNSSRSDLFFHDSNGEFVAYASFNKYLKENAEKLIGRRITTHALRHTHASLLLANGVNIETISRRLGHENSAVTREIYLHVTNELKKRDNLQIEKIKIL